MASMQIQAQDKIVNPDISYAGTPRTLKLGGINVSGVDGMAQFVKAADQINVAIGEEMGEEALPALSKMVETMGLIPKMGIEKAMLATGSAMFKLSSTSTSTSTNIVEFAKRLTGVSRTAGITTDQLLALGSASDSLFDASLIHVLSPMRLMKAWRSSSHLARTVAFISGVTYASA